MSESDFQFVIVTDAPSASVGYRLVREVRGQRCSHPKGLSLSLDPFRFPSPMLPQGLYFADYYDSAQRLIRTSSVPVRWNGRSSTPSVSPSVSTSVSPSDNDTGDEVPPLSTHLALAGEAAWSLELEERNYRTSEKAASAKFFGTTLELFEGVQRVMGQHSAREFQVRNEQLDQLARSTKVMLDTQLDMMETFRKHAHNLKTPEPPPQWDKIASVVIPAIQEMYCETVRGIRGVGKRAVGASRIPPFPSVGGPSDEASEQPMEPTDAERVSRLKSLMGLLTNEESMRALRSDPETLKRYTEAISAIFGAKNEE